MSESALHIVADALGVPRGAGTPCAFCVDSPFDPWGDTSGVSEAVAAERADMRTDVVCAGCRRILEGKPGSDPPPVRMRHLLVRDGVYSTPDRAGLRDLIADTQGGSFVASWAESGKKHHALYARLSTAETYRWGSDRATIEFDRLDAAECLHAVEELCVHHTRSSILSGSYDPIRIAKSGPARWADLEAVVAPHRGRQMLALICDIARKPETPQPEEEDRVTDPHDEIAADILASVARSSSVRAEDGINFWKTYLRRRIQRHVHRGLRDAVSRLLDECGCSSVSHETEEAIRILDTLSADDTAAVAASLRERTALVVSMAYARRNA